MATVTRNALTHAQFFKLCEHLRTHKDHIEKKKMGPTAAAKHAGHALKFYVSPNTIKTAVEALGEEAPKLATRSPSDSQISDERARTKRALNRSYRNRKAIYRLVEVIRQLDPSAADDILQIIKTGTTPESMKESWEKHRVAERDEAELDEESGENQEDAS